MKLRTEIGAEMLSVCIMQLVRLRLCALLEGGNSVPCDSFIHSTAEHMAWWIAANTYDRRKVSHKAAAVHVCENACRFIDKSDVFAGDELQDKSEAKRVLLHAKEKLLSRSPLSFMASTE